MKRQLNESVVKAINILNLFIKEQKELTLSEIAEKTQMSLSTTYRILTTLEAKDYLKKVKYTNQNVQYFLGLTFLNFGQIVSEKLSIRESALPYMIELRDTLNEIVHLAILDEDKAVYIEKVESCHNLRLHTTVGTSFPLHIGSGPKLLFAYMPDETKDSLIDNYDFETYKNKNILDEKSLRQELKQIKKQGYAISREEQDAGTIGISFPVMNHTHQISAALTVSCPLERFKDENENNIFSETKKTAGRLSKALGYDPDKKVYYMKGE